MPWNERFLALFTRCVHRYSAGDLEWSGYYDAANLALLSSIGCRQREFFDFVEDLQFSDCLCRFWEKLYQKLWQGSGSDG